jgi:hypothetical protein
VASGRRLVRHLQLQRSVPLRVRQGAGERAGAAVGIALTALGIMVAFGAVPMPGLAPLD